VRAALIVFKELNGNPSDVAIRSQTQYGRAVRVLKKNLEHPVDCYSTDNLCAAMALTIYEIIAANNECYWIHHAGGLGKLIQLRGPHRHQEYPDHA
jgi:Fungal specific transcription factor domain